MARASQWIEVSQTSDATANDSDKTLTVGTSHAWRILSIAAQLVTTATVGNRQLDVLITDASNNLVAKYVAGAVQAASLTRIYVFAPDHPQETTFSDTLMLRALASGLVIPAGFKVRIYDSAAIDAAADDLTIRLLVEDMVE